MKHNIVQKGDKPGDAPLTKPIPIPIPETKKEGDSK